MQKQISYWVIKIYGRILNAYYQMKEANLKKLHPIWFQLHDFLRKAKLRTVKRSVLPGFREESVMNSWNTENFYGSKNTLYDTVMVGIDHKTFVKTHSMYNTKNKP